MTKAKRTLDLIHGAKFDWRARISCVPLDDIDVLVTEILRPDMAGELRNANVKIVSPEAKTEGP